MQLLNYDLVRDPCNGRIGMVIAPYMTGKDVVFFHTPGLETRIKPVSADFEWVGRDTRAWRGECPTWAMRKSDLLALLPIKRGKEIIAFLQAVYSVMNRVAYTEAKLRYRGLNARTPIRVR